MISTTTITTAATTSAVAPISTATATIKTGEKPISKDVPAQGIFPAKVNQPSSCTCTRLEWCSLFSPDTGPSPPNAPNWCFGPFEPEGIMSSISAILSCIIGVHYGHVLIHFKDHFNRLLHWIVPGICLMLLGTILHVSNAIILNKQLYSFSYVCFTAGAATLVFSAFYILIDVFQVRYPTLMLEWMGMNALLVFVFGASDVLASFINGFYYGSSNNTLIHWVKKHLFFNVWHSQRVGGLLYVLFGEILFWGVVSGLLHSQGWYWKL